MGEIPQEQTQPEAGENRKREYRKEGQQFALEHHPESQEKQKRRYEKSGYPEPAKDQVMGNIGARKSQPVVGVLARFDEVAVAYCFDHALVGFARKEVGDKGCEQEERADEQEESQRQVEAGVFEEGEAKSGAGLGFASFFFLGFLKGVGLVGVFGHLKFKKYSKTNEKRPIANYGVGGPNSGNTLETGSEGASPLTHRLSSSNSYF